MGIFGNLLTSLQNLSSGTQLYEITKQSIDPNIKFDQGKKREIVRGHYGEGSITNTSPLSDEKDNTDINGSPYNNGNLIFSVPNWGYQDFIYERTSWQKGLDSITGDPGWFYFKVFFKFDTNYGLLGCNGINGWDKGSFTQDCALHYLRSGFEHYTAAHMEDRYTSLQKFIASLSFINSKAPWFFQGINGLNDAFVIQDFTKPMENRKIELVMREDAVDMRVSTLFDLYKYACYDYINMKEVVPENLRKFDMIVVLFHTPIRYYHTGMQTMRRGTFEYKSLHSDNADDRMSYKMFTFQGCEFDHNSLSSIYPSSINNNEPFSLAKEATIAINYKRVYQHTFNEWGRFMVGDDGFYVGNNTTGITARQKAITDAYENPYYSNPSAQIFKAMVDASEAKIKYAMRMIDPTSVLGNIYEGVTNPYGPYFQDKIAALKKGSPRLRETPLNARNR